MYWDYVVEMDFGCKLVDVPIVLFVPFVDVVGSVEFGELVGCLEILVGPGADEALLFVELAHDESYYLGVADYDLADVIGKFLAFLCCPSPATSR